MIGHLDELCAVPKIQQVNLASQAQDEPQRLRAGRETGGLMDWKRARYSRRYGKAAGPKASRLRPAAMRRTREPI